MINRLLLFFRYIFFFQLPRLPEIFISMGDYQTIEDFGRKGCDDDDDDLEAFKYAMSRPGMLILYMVKHRNIAPWIFDNLRGIVPGFTEDVKYEGRLKSFEPNIERITI